MKNKKILRIILIIFILITSTALLVKIIPNNNTSNKTNEKVETLELSDDYLIF